MNKIIANVTGSSNKVGIIRNSKNLRYHLSWFSGCW